MSRYYATNYATIFPRSHNAQSILKLLFVCKSLFANRNLHRRFLELYSFINFITYKFYNRCLQRARHYNSWSVQIFLSKFWYHYDPRSSTSSYVLVNVSCLSQRRWIPLSSSARRDLSSAPSRRSARDSRLLESVRRSVWDSRDSAASPRTKAWP